MFKIFSKKLPSRDRVEENEEWMREIKGIEMCPVCENVYYKKRWHRSLASLAKLSKNFEKSKLNQKICPACKIIRDHAFEGEVFIENIPSNYLKDIENLIHAFGQRTIQKDPQDRIIKVEKGNDGFRVTTTENQMAVRLAKKIRDAYRSVNLDISHAPEPAEVSRVKVTFF